MGKDGHAAVADETAQSDAKAFRRFDSQRGNSGDGGNQFPHGLFFSRAEDATPEIRALCFEFRVPPTKGSTP